jgi:hypothetical protein
MNNHTIVIYKYLECRTSRRQNTADAAQPKDENVINDQSSKPKSRPYCNRKVLETPDAIVRGDSSSSFEPRNNNADQNAMLNIKISILQYCAVNLAATATYVTESGNIQEKRRDFRVVPD